MFSPVSLRQYPENIVLQRSVLSPRQTSSSAPKTTHPSRFQLASPATLDYVDSSAKGASSPRKGPCPPPVPQNSANLLSAWLMRTHRQQPKGASYVRQSATRPPKPRTIQKTSQRTPASPSRRRPGSHSSYPSPSPHPS